eukprot:3886768-Rhodomonas_salina.1
MYPGTRVPVPRPGYALVRAWYRAPMITRVLASALRIICSDHDVPRWVPRDDWYVHGAPYLVDLPVGYPAPGYFVGPS